MTWVGPGGGFEQNAVMHEWRPEWDAWVEFSFDRSAGPGGQNVNKLNTRVTLLLDFERCPDFSPAQRERIRTRLGNRLSQDGRLRIVAQSERSQSANREAARERLLALLERAFHTPLPRRATRPTAGARRRRLSDKRQRGELKKQRQSRPD